MTSPRESDKSYPRTETTRYGFAVDKGIASHIERVIDLGLTPRASCSGLDCDHSPESEVTPYLSIQIAPTFDAPRPTTELPTRYLNKPLLKRLQRVGARADWIVSDGTSWMLYPTVTFRLSPTRGVIKNRLFGRDCDFDALSEAEETRLDQRYDTAREAFSRLSDNEIETRWDRLLEELTIEFESETLPQFNDRQEAFEEIQEEFPEVFEIFFDSDEELLKFYDR